MTLTEEVKQFLLPHLAVNPELSFAEYEELDDYVECSKPTFYTARRAALHSMTNKSTFDSVDSVQIVEGLPERMAQPVMKLLELLREPGCNVTGLLIKPDGVQVQELQVTSFSVSELLDHA